MSGSRGTQSEQPDINVRQFSRRSSFFMISMGIDNDIEVEVL